MLAVSDSPALSIGEVARRAGLRTSHIRYYEDVGVLPATDRVAGQRRYREDVLHRLAIISVAQRAGFTLKEIRDLTVPRRDGRASERLHELAERKLPDVRALIERAQAVERWLEIAMACDCDSVDVCTLFTDPTFAALPDDPKLDVRLVGVARPRGSRLDLKAP